MAAINSHFQKLTSHYLFPRIEKEAALLKEKKPDALLINLGIGDVTLPLAPSVVSALTDAAQEMGSSVKGYGPSQGYLFLRDLIKENEYKDLSISSDEIFVSDGAKCDISTIPEIFSPNCKVAIANPAYPVYVDTSVMAGREILYLPCTEETGFLPRPPREHVDLVYLCSPSNPTGAALSRKDLKAWVEYARKEKALLLFDAAYSSFITSDAPQSIYEIEGAEEVAIEFKSFSKNAGFTGLRCSFYVFPKTLHLQKEALYALWKRRNDTKFGGVSYLIQKGAAAVYSPQGKKEIAEQIATYKRRTKLFRDGLKNLGFTVYGGTDAPFVWCKAPNGFSSWQFFDTLLHNAHIICVPGSGFGECGEGFVRFSCFTDEKTLQEALNRIQRHTS
jgi:LL-diaminopimelate aminotransferase